MALTNKPLSLPIEFDDLDVTRWLHTSATYRVALLIPLCGAAGIWSPSCISSAQVAAAELNRRSGIDGRKVELIMIDAAIESDIPLEETIRGLIQRGAIDAIVGMHISAMRHRIRNVVHQKIPFIYTPLYEGGERTDGLFAIGETPEEQLGPSLNYIQQTYQPRRWAMVGNNYVWPRLSNHVAKQNIRAFNADLVYERYLPFGFNKMEDIVEAITNSEAEAVLISLIGQDAITFNRAFGQADLHNQMVRLSCAIEENGLLGCGAKNTKRMFVASAYFSTLRTEANAAFKEHYFQLHGENAPVLNTLGQSMYEGLHFLAGLMRNHRNDWQSYNFTDSPLVAHRSVRKFSNGTSKKRAPIYLARADGLKFTEIQRL